MRTTREALVIAAHGSHLHPDSARPAFAHADRIRETGRFSTVRAAFWKEEPSFREVLRTVDSRMVYVVPLFMSEGYFTDRILRRELGLTADEPPDGEREVIVTEPVGTHPLLADVVIHRAVEVTGDPDVGPGTGLAVVGHGTERHERSARSTLDHVDRIRERDRFDEVAAFFLDEPPEVVEIPSAFDADEVVVVPLFVADGHHTTHDIPHGLGFANGGLPTAPVTVDGQRIWYSGAVGTDSRMADVVVDRAAGAGALTGPGAAGHPHEAIETVESDRDEISSAVLLAAEDGISFDGFDLTRCESGYSVRTPADAVVCLDREDLRRWLTANREYVTDWYHWRRRVRSPGTPEYAFLRWLERAAELDVTRRYERLRRGIDREWGQLLVRTRLTADGERVHAVRHAHDRDAPGDSLTTHREPPAARDIARFDDRGSYRPVSGTPTLPTGWRFVGLSPTDLLTVIELIYPAGVPNWHRERRGCLDVSHWAETAGRQTGIYGGVRDLDPEVVNRVARECCSDRTCLRRRVWQYDDDHDLEAPSGDGAIPCREPCSFLIAAARERLSDQDETP